MTDEQIIKALEHCTKDGCSGCPLYEPNIANCVKRIMVNALNLVERQKAEIADSKDEITELKKTNKHLSNEYIALSKECDKLKAEIERLTKLLDDKCDRCIERDRADAIK